MFSIQMLINLVLKKAHSTDQCIYVLKEIVQLYKSLNTCISVCFLDASKAFDRVNHQRLFEKLDKRGIPGLGCIICPFPSRIQGSR